MSELREALAAILRVNFREPIPASEQARIGEFLERAALDLVGREEAVSQREAAVSQREANAELRAGEITAQVNVLGSLQRVRKTLELKPAGTGKRWLRRA